MTNQVRLWKRVAVVVLAAVASASLAACNTVRGAGKDLEKAGEALQKAGE
ncbi:MAG: entericidin A/B family lipoprotein [Phycisphaerales bacterium]|nr:entericidin A/B family lipoprotein [Phycisphaerales bacterium]